MRNERNFVKLIAFAATLFLLGACQAATENRNANAPVENRAANDSPTNVNQNAAANANAANGSAANSPAKSESHAHVAPHGGTLVAFGEEFAHLELVLDAATGQLTAYALDGEAEKSVPLAQEEIEIVVEKPRRFTVRLAATENALTGEKKGATSEFRAQVEELKNLTEFDAAVKAIKIRGRDFKNTHFNFPKGNEDKHEH
jgi:hypothetical protein